MRTTILVCACLASIAACARLFAQDSETCPQCKPATTGETTAGAGETTAGAGETAANAGETTAGAGETSGDAAQAGCNPGQGNCDPYTYYELREAWRQEVQRHHGPVCSVVKNAHTVLHHKHHKCNGNAAAYYRSLTYPWHGAYYYPQWGAPVSLVVPPTAEFQTNYSWGVPSTRRSPIDHQFRRSFPGYGPGVVGDYGFLPPPLLPNDTMQSGVYYVRGPW